MTRVNGAESDSRHVVCGVPQGSILGPLIFISYINSLPSVLQYTLPYLYADDMALVVTEDNEEDIMNKLSDDLNACSTWLTNHRLALNIGKTKLMFFGTTASISNVTTTERTFDKGVVYIVNEYKYLGMLLGSRHRFDRHANYIYSKI